MRIYITRMSIDSKVQNATFHQKAYALIDALNELGNKTVYISDLEFNDYEYIGIYKALATCDCLLAFTDRYTFSSTWRASEITYAICGMGAREKVEFHIPVFLYRGIDDYSGAFLESTIKQPDVFVLPDKIASAARSLVVKMAEIKKNGL